MHGNELPLITALPFVALLLVIALAPLAVPGWWHHNRNKALVSLVISAPILLYLGRTAPELLNEKLHEYLSFIVVIFIVANCAGLLTPIGDPPLLLGYLKGVPFDWTLRLWPQWLMVNGMLLVVFNVWDRWALQGDEQELQTHEPLRIRGGLEMLVLLGIIATILLAGSSLIILGLAVLGYFAGSGDRRTRNAFTFGPIIEVAVLFAAIFATMAPVLEMLNAWAQRPDFDD